MKPLAVYSRGQGPDMVLLHGWGLHAGIWYSLTERLQADMTCHAVDLPGHGRSPAKWRGLNNWTDALAETIPPRALILGWSLGSVLALNLALRHPQRVRGLVLIAATPRFLKSADWPHGHRPSNLRSMAAGLENDYVSTLHEFLVLQMLGQPGARILMRELRQSLLDRPPQIAGLQAGLEILEDTDLRARVGEIGQPAMLMAGELDRLTHPQASHWLAQNMSNAALWSLPKSAHAPFISHEAECAARIRVFADDVPD